jgi:uncharacterized membrane protein HdeD (DUF308 family)
MKDEGALNIARMLLEQSKAERHDSMGEQFLLGIALLLAGFVARSYGLPGALFTLGVALLLSGAIDLFRWLRLEDIEI